MTAPHAAALADKLSRRNERAFNLLSTLKSHNLVLSKLFVIDGVLLCQIKRLIESSVEVQQQLGATSFDALIADPSHEFDSATKCHLQVQTINLWWLWLRFDHVMLYRIGRARFGLINPEMEAWYDRVMTGKATYRDARAAGGYWLEAAQTLTVSGLQALLIERSIQYTRTDGETPSTPLNGAQTGRYEVMLDNVPMRVGNLRQMTHGELLSWLGVGDMRDDDYLYTRTARPRPKD